MAIRCGYSIGRNTAESSLSDQLKRFQPKTISEPPSHAKSSKKLLYKQSFSADRPPNPAHETLAAKCTAVVVANFERMPVTKVIPPPQMAAITKLLPTNLNPIIGARYIYDESYWKRCCVEKYGWHNCILAEHGLLWKQLYFEKLIQDKLEEFDIQTEGIDSLYEFVDACMDYIFTIVFRQLPSHIDLSELTARLPNLSKLDITYGIKKIGMNYERMLFGMKISDATSLAKVFDRTETLTTLIMSGNMIDDDLLRMLMTGLIKNNTITALDFSHNKITNHGARLLSKLLGENSVISSLNLSDNEIHSEGGRYLARGLRENDSLQSLNLRLNRLADDGCRLLLEGLQDNISVTDLNIASNSAGSQAAQTLFSIIRDPEHKIQSLDISGNDLAASHFELLRLSLANNKSLTSIDMRHNPGFAEAEKAIQEIERLVHNNETNARRANRHP